MPGQVACFEKRREYFPVGSTPPSLPARVSKQATCPFIQSVTSCLNDVVLPLLPAHHVSFTVNGYNVAHKRNQERPFAKIACQPVFADVGDMNERLIADEEDIQHAARCLKAMSHPIRLKILCILGAGPASVQEIVEQVGTTQSNVSQHLAILREKGLLAFDKEANRVFYRIDDPSTLQLIKKIREVFCRHS